MRDKVGYLSVILTFNVEQCACPGSVRLGRPSQAVSRRQATASRRTSAGIDFTAERGEVVGTTVGLSLRHPASNNTLGSC